MWDVKCSVCELVDMTCFAFFWMPRSHVMWFLFRGTLQMTRDLCIFLFLHFADDMGVCVFWVCPTTPMSSAGSISLSTAFFTILEQKNPHWFCWCRIKLGCSDGVKGGDGGLGSCRYADSVLMANELCRDQWHPVTHWQMSRHCRVLESPQKL